MDHTKLVKPNLPNIIGTVPDSCFEISDANTTRTFVKVSVSELQFNRSGNSHNELNELFEYSWDMFPREHGVRNSPYSI